MYFVFRPMFVSKGVHGSGSADRDHNESCILVDQASKEKIISECSCYSSDPLFMEETSSASCFLLVRVSALIINLE